MTARRRRGRRGRRVVGVLATVLVTFVIGAVALVALGRMTGTFDIAVVLSGSMEPAMYPADVVVLVDRTADQVAVGDVLAFAPSRTMEAASPALTLHRVIDIERDGPTPLARTKGDANASVDPWRVPLDGSAEVAEVTRRVPLLGHVVLWAQGRTGRIVLYVAAVVLLAGPVLGWVRRQWRGERTSDHDEPNVSDRLPSTDTSAIRVSDERLFPPRAAVPGAGPDADHHDRYAVDTRSRYVAPGPQPHDRSQSAH